MITRVLPESEWHRLKGYFPELAKYVTPKNLKVVVVEDGDRIVATMGVLHLTYFECVEVDPAYRNAGVVRSLMRKSKQVARKWSEKWALGGAADEHMHSILQRLGGKKLEPSFYMLPIDGGELCQRQS